MTKNKEIHTQTLKIPRLIILTAKLLEFFSSNLVTLFAAKLFTTPIKHKIPKRELQMELNSFQQLVIIPSLNKEIVVYFYGESKRKILLVHGWSGRGTQLVKIADELLNLGYSTISFDAPAHGKSKGKTTILPEFIASILELEKQFGPFEYAIGHSLGGMSILNAIKSNLNIKKAVIIGSGNIIEDIIDDFIYKLNLNPKISLKLITHFETKFGEEMNSYSSSLVAKEITIPILILHDLFDNDVNVKSAYHIHENLINSKLFITEGLGHRKILGNPRVINQITSFIIN